MSERIHFYHSSQGIMVSYRKGAYNRQFGLDADNRPSTPQERGIAEMMLDVYDTWSAPLNDETCFAGTA
ncbi:hypothetical protein GGE50_003275 [Rhizobium leguminosarum]|jgi:hypothetical protein|nr:hypothetical protein [Rhizobium leguminosarum]MBB4340244.1 hypothetical protein [Rhizobium leguminosarum]MBB4354442.1 hypothetical protein [Rhizobium leguminosarum]MBB4383846.1 hypothetical protein [Rhizobium leguminosarum]MBB4466199.1 hypothetical protein [Rhizobium leguminosarum]